MTPQISRTFGWPTLQSSPDYLKCMLGLHGLASAYLLDELSHSRVFHSYNTRHTRDLLCLPLARTTKFQGSFRFSGAKILNTLLLDLWSEHDINKFAFGLKRYFRSSIIKSPLLLLYLLSCTIFFVLCCCFFFLSGPHSNQPRWTGYPWVDIV